MTDHLTKLLQHRWWITGAVAVLNEERDRRLQMLPPQTLDEIEHQIRDLVYQLQRNFYEEMTGDDSTG